MSAKFQLMIGEKYPYDGEYTDDGVLIQPANNDWADRAARGVLSELTDRSGIKQALYGVDIDTRKEIVENLAAIIREAHGGQAE